MKEHEEEAAAATGGEPQQERTAARLRAGEVFPSLAATDIHGRSVAIPAPDRRPTHLQFRRFAGCPVCNLHLHTFAQRHAELSNAGVQEIVVFHSSDAELLEYQSRFPFHVIGDPEKRLYRKYGFEKSLLAVLDPRSWSAGLRGNLRQDKPVVRGMPNGGALGLPADFFVTANGTIKAVHYGKHADDQWSVDDVLALARP
jgi:peroxiredoxin